jgi:hypothetical protein
MLENLHNFNNNNLICQIIGLIFIMLVYLSIMIFIVSNIDDWLEKTSELLVDMLIFYDPLNLDPQKNTLK